MNINNKLYWNKFYRSDKKEFKPSNFAKFLKKKHIKKNDIILDVATGDGRDAFYFSKYAKFIYGIDKSNVAIKLNKLKKKKRKLNNLIFLNLDAKKISFFRNKKITIIYARFFIHAIKANVENKFISEIRKNFKKETKIALEFRTTKDELIKKGKKVGENERITSHYRRFINLEKFEEKVIKCKFKIIYKKVGKNLSKTKTDNPYLCRLILSKNEKK